MKLILSATTLCLLAAGVFNAPVAAGQSVKVANAWVRATAPSQTTASVYLDLTSDSNAAVVAAGSALALRAELHSMSVEGGVMRMRPLARIDLPAGQTVKLAPNGQHIMLIDLKRPLKSSERIPLALTVQSTGASLVTLNIEAEVRGVGSADSHKH